MHKTNMMYRIAICGMALVMLAGCRHPQQERAVELSSPIHEETAPIEETTNIISEVRRPDVKVHVKRGQALLMQTEGLTLAAVDAAVQREADYSVTSLVSEELPPLPQGMMNMTAATAGYRLLPGGEHFLPYAELRMTYDPERLPEGYTPDDIYTSYYDTATLAWVRLERVEVDTVNHEIVSLTTHFTDFINELLKAPEMPETQAFVPTAMSDLEAVSPMDGLTLITPPEANNEGTANLNYPIRVPAGRAGMQPNLSVNYSSSGGNGWLGVGWELSVPSIMLDTRWGVPRYNPIYETEIYLLSGEQLITRDSNGSPRPMPHRTNNQTTRSSLGDSVRFYARTGDAHDSIIRHNTSTTNYWWEVVDRNGITHYFGHYPDSTLNTAHETTLKDGHGNIAKWMLAESRDTYGNWVRYYYDVVTTGGTNPGKQIYIEHIEYAGNNNDSGKYSVNFIRKKRNPKDIPVSCNWGFKETTDQELCGITVNMDRDEILGYFFEKENTYKSNFKTRLKSIYMTANGSGELLKWCAGEPVDSVMFVNRQDFEYYDAPFPQTLFSDKYESPVEFDLISAFMRYAGFRDDSVVTTTALGLTHSSNWSIGGTLGVGLGADVSKTTSSIGGNYHWSESSSESLVTLADLDGDGLADQVYIWDGTIYWRKQIVSTDSILSFGEKKRIDGINHFLVENGKTSTWGVQANYLDIAKGSGSWSNTTSTTSTYFADVDGDGLTDLVVDGQVYFNRIVNGEPTFTRYAEPPSQEEEDEPEAQQPVCDSIIFDGKVSDSVACDRVWVLDTVYHYFEDTAWLMEKYQTFQAAEDSAAVIVYNDSGQYDVVCYRAEMDCSQKNLASRGVPNTESVRVWVAPNSGTADITYTVDFIQDTNVYRYRHVDGATYVVQHSRDVQLTDGYSLHSTQNLIIDTHYFCGTCWGDAYHSEPLSIEVDSGDLLMFRLQSMDDRQFDKVSDAVNITLNGTTYSSFSSFILTDKNYFEAPYDGHYTIEVETSNINNGITLDTIKPSSLDSSIAKGDTIQLIASFTDTSTMANWDNVDIRARIQFWSDSLADTMTVWTSGLKKIEHPDGHIWGDSTYQRLFGPLYNGWGQFTYYPRKSRSQLIVVDSLIAARRVLMGNESLTDQDEIERQISDTLSADDFNTAGIDDFGNNHSNLYTPLSDATYWVEMTADAEHNRWVAFGAQNSIGRDTMSNMMQKEWYNSAATDDSDMSQPPTSYHDDAVPPAAPDGTPAKAILKVNSTRNQSYTGSVLMFSGAYSNGNSNIETDYLDMNGDRYPDIVGTGYVQYRQQWGGLGNVKGLPFGINDVTASVTNSVGASFGASPVSHNRTTSSKPAKAKFTISGDGSSVNGEFNVGWDHASSSWTDINGDGLPDYVTKDGHVRLNTGYDFLGEEDWNFTPDHALHSGMSASGTSSAGVPITNIAQGSIQFGVGLSRSVNRTDHTLMDINGDGLPDLIWRNVLDFHGIHSWRDLLDPRDSIHVRFNLGNGEWSDTVYDLNIKNFNWSEAYNESLNLGATVGFTIFGLKATVGINGTANSRGTNRDRMQLVDVNGDGLPDLVTSDRKDRISVQYNMGGRTNLLKKVTNCTGSEIYLSYSLSIPDYHQPSRTWLLDRVTTHDPLNPNGGDTSVTVFEYSNPNYNRFERTFFGYGTIVTKQINPADGSVYRKVEQDFCNTNILNKGRILRTLTSDGENNKYIEKVYQYDYASYDGGELDTCTGNAYSIGDRVVTRYYEGDAIPKLTVAETYQYDRYHNVIKYIDEGDTANSDDSLTVDFTYYSDQLNNLIGLRESYIITPTGSTSPLREVWYEYNPHGKLIIQTLGSGSNVPVYEFEYDTTYGNLIKSILPRNKNNQRMEYLYTYDDLVHTYPVHIENSFLDTTTTTYDYHFGKPLTMTDPSGSTMTYTYDCLGRLTSVRSPKNTSSLPSVRYFYYTNGRYQPPMCSHEYYQEHAQFFGSNMTHSRPYTITEHFDDEGRLITRTVIIADGFGRVLQTKKGLREDNTDVMQVSGRMMVDAFGRTVRQYDPFTVADTTLGSLGHFEPYMDSTAIVTSYDVLDRTTRTVQPLGVTTRVAYDIDDDRRFVTTMTDPNNNVTTQYADYEGRKVQVTDANGGITLMRYDNLGQLVNTIDPEGFSTTYEYDMLGRMTKRVHPDAGETRYTYDNAGNLVEESNPLGKIFYDYTYYRVLNKRYSSMTGNNVTYTYGTSGTQRGRPIHISDGSGSHELTYDALGNVTAETRTIVLPNSHEEFSLTMNYEYDSWGRMLSMTYPDGEVVSYTYQWGGDLYSMHGNKGDNHRVYVSKILYNTFGQRSHVTYGNSTSAEYSYDALHRLTNLRSRNGSGTLMQDISYTFDSASNVTGITNTAGVVNSLGGGYGNSYQYDALHRLVKSTGGGASTGTYDIDMGYSGSGRIKSKYRSSLSPTLSGTVNMYYGYCDDRQPHAVRRIYDEYNQKHYDFRWDASGNLGQVSYGNGDAQFESGRFMYWTEDNRMHVAVDDKHYSYYAYDYSGERRIKLTGDNSVLDVNAEFMRTVSTLEKVTLYPSAYMVLTDRGYTKHYYTGMERVAARIGDGGLDVGFYLSNTDSLHARANRLFGQSLEQANHRVLEANDVDCIMDGEMPVEELGIPFEEIPERMQAEVSTEYGRFIVAMHHDGGSPDVYYYHGDHLGSASWITDASGAAVQHLQYLPFGERFVDQRTSGYCERFTFTGKERDEETGFGYFGARYMDYELMTMWLSVDPLADKYPSISPYAYCVWNPVRLVDPDGRIVKDQNGNIVFCVTNANAVYIQGDQQLPNGNKVYIYFEATKGKILANNGMEITAYRANNSTIYAVEMTPNGEVVSKKTCEGDFDNSYNCTGNAFTNQLFTISSDQINASFLQCEGYSALEANQPPCSGDIGIYSSTIYEHFEVFLTPNMVSTKGGIQADPGPSAPGEHPYFSKGTTYSIWRRLSQDRMVTVQQESSTITSPGINTVNSETFEKIKQSLE